MSGPRVLFGADRRHVENPLLPGVARCGMQWPYVATLDQLRAKHAAINVRQAVRDELVAEKVEMPLCATCDVSQRRDDARRLDAEPGLAAEVAALERMLDQDPPGSGVAS